MRHLVLGMHIIIMPESAQGGEKLVRIIEVLTEVPSTAVDLLHLSSPSALGRNE
jgi:hypothetical protein